MRKQVHIIGGGFAGLASAIALADKGFNVTILEKNKHIGGRARKFEESGFVFDMGPSWYWMPEVFDNFFERYGKKTSDYYNLVRLNPSYRVFFKEQFIDVPADFQELMNLFEKLEKGSAEKLEKFMHEAQYKYDIGVNKLVYHPSKTIFEFIKPDIIKGMLKYPVFTSLEKVIDSMFLHHYIREILKFPVLFLGAKPKDTPSLYSLMNYADMKLGTWYPMGGMYKIVEALEKLALEKGVILLTDTPVTSIETTLDVATNIISNKQSFRTDFIVGAADYQHIDSKILSNENRQYSDKYWNSRNLAPSALIYYVGLNRKLKNVLHHNLFFDEDFSVHSQEIYDNPAWPKKPLFYMCVPSVTDSTVAPEGHENIFILIPVAPGIEETDDVRDRYFNIVLKRIKEKTGEEITENDIVYKKSYAHKEFINDYNSFKGNAYGLSNTLLQTAFLKPKMHHKKIKNMVFSGQLTVPGPGVPPALISGLVAAQEAEKFLNN